MPRYRILWAGALLFLVGSTIIAEQSSPDHSRAKSKGTSSASADDSDLAPPSILIPLPEGLSEQPGPKATTRVEAEVIHATSSTGLDLYINNSILPLIRANWYILVSKSKEKVGGDATVEFTILKNGRVAETNLSDGAGHAVLGDLALNAVKKSDPFPVLPAEFTAPSLTMHAHFQYEGATTMRDTFAAGMTVNVDGVDEPVYQILGEITSPKPVYDPNPEFSEEARKKGVSGTVTLRFVVTSKGDVTDIKVMKSVGSGLDEKAIEAVRHWKFKPATKDGESVSVLTAVEVSFNLERRGR